MDGWGGFVVNESSGRTLFLCILYEIKQVQVQSTLWVRLIQPDPTVTLVGSCKLATRARREAPFKLQTTGLNKRNALVAELAVDAAEFLQQDLTGPKGAWPNTVKRGAGTAGETNIASDGSDIEIPGCL